MCRQHGAVPGVRGGAGGHGGAQGAAYGLHDHREGLRFRYVVEARRYFDLTDLTCSSFGRFYMHGMMCVSVYQCKGVCLGVPLKR